MTDDTATPSRHRFAAPLAALALTALVLAGPLAAIGWLVFGFEVADATFAAALTIAAGASAVRLGLGDEP